MGGDLVQQIAESNVQATMSKLYKKVTYIGKRSAMVKSILPVECKIFKVGKLIFFQAGEFKVFTGD